MNMDDVWEAYRRWLEEREERHYLTAAQLFDLSLLYTNREGLVGAPLLLYHGRVTQATTGIKLPPNCPLYGVCFFVKRPANSLYGPVDFYGEVLLVMN